MAKMEKNTKIEKKEYKRNQNEKLKEKNRKKCIRIPSVSSNFTQ